MVAVAVGLVALAVAPVAGGATGSSSAVRADSEGWWNVTSTPVTLPASPLGPLPAVPAVDVPEGSVPVTMRAGQPARVGAIGIPIDAPKGSTVTRLVLHLKEADATGQQGSSPMVRACPITSFLVPETNGPPENAPEEDCDLAHADGRRSDDGTWSFDLTAMAAAWLDPFGTLSPNGIRLDPVGDAPASFQVAFTGFEDATFDADITAGGGAAADPFATGGTGSSGGSFGSSFDSGSGAFAGPAVDLPPLAAPSPSPSPSTAAPSSRGPARPVTPTAASRAGHTLGNWPVTVVALLLGAAALALLTGWSLGPAGRAEAGAASRRQGGVGRALARRLAAAHRS